MFEVPAHRYTVPFDGKFKVADAPTRAKKNPGRKTNKKKLEEANERLEDLQRVLYADDRHSLLLIFQAMDAAGKDSTIRAVFSGVNPAGFQVSSFKQPSANELDHDFLWRTAQRLPQRGRIGIFNRSYYEEALVVRVHPEILDFQRLPHRPKGQKIWRDRLRSMLDHEAHLARNGTVVLKFWLNVSREEQKNRFLSRLDEPHKNWKFSKSDVKERGYWDDYMKAYEAALNATSKPWAPWFAIPADDKPYMRRTVAEIVCSTLSAMDLRYPEVDEALKSQFDDIRARLVAE